MKKNLFLLFFVTSAIYAQPPGQWIWIHGSNVANASANWGVQGVPSPTNVPHSAYEACQWTDLNGNFWLFGGMGDSGTYSALWKYEPSTNQWTWMKGPNTMAFVGDFGIQGVPSATNLPPLLAYGVTTWTDLQGNLWLFGGWGIGGPYSALWKYEIATNTWTWMKGPSSPSQPGIYGIQGVPDINNYPRSRAECMAAWTDNSGDLWLFGGEEANSLNDLWRFNIATNTWTWMKGSSSLNQPGVYGTLNVEDSANTPGSRMSYAHWKDNQGNLWLMGGRIPFQSGTMNDLWKYNIATNNWTWKGGYQAPNAGGAYGTLCSSIPPFPQFPNVPGARYENRSVITDQNGNFWLFGGGRGSILYLWNDLWMYCVSTGNWSWQGGHNGVNPTGNWGTINVPSPLNVPDGRVGAVTWYDNNNHIYMFGGKGINSSIAFNYNDLWKFTIDPDCYACPVVSTDITSANIACFEQCTGSAGVVVSGGTPPYAYLWSNSQTTQSINSLCAGTYTVTVTDSFGFNTTSSVTITQPSAIASNLSSTPTDLSCIGSATVAPSGGTPPYQLLWSNSSTSATINNLCSGWHYVTITDANDCVHYDSVFVNLNTGVHPLIPEDFNLFFNSTIGELNIDNITFTVKGVAVYDMIGQSVYHLLPNTNSRSLTVDISHLKPGIYFVKVLSSNKIFVRKMVKL